jgi:exosortase H (IPTLxxWG-CTERM-specific)
MKKWRKKFREHWFLLKFGPLFLFLIILFFLLVGHQFFSEAVPIEHYFTRAVANVSGVVLGIIGLDNRVEGTKLYTEDPDPPIPNFFVDLKTGCNGLVAVLIFISAVLAFPASLKHKVMGIVLGTLVIQGFNVIRIGVLFYLGLHHRELFEAVHVYVAQSILIAIAAALWLFWSARFSRQPGPAGQPGLESR